MKNKIIFIINPHSGVDRSKALEATIREHLDQDYYDPEIARTQYAGHGTVIAKEAIAKGVKYIVAVGGDGSVNDIGKALAGTDALLGIIPLGSGNGLARSLNIPLEAAKAISLLNKRKVAKIDVGYANDVMFLSNAGVGFDMLVAKRFKGSKRRGLLVYASIVLKHFWTYKEWLWDIEIDGQLMQKKAFIITAANAAQFGYNFKIAPLAEMQDGMLDIVVVKKFPKILGALITLKAFNATLNKSSFVDYIKAKHIVIKHPDLRYMQVDGDVHETLQNYISIKLVDNWLSIICD